jgi:D-glycero-D-manno-heptose 1,7-bisphosphate phosphatase
MEAVFIDRDGVINELVYYPEQGIIDSPFTMQQFELLPGVSQAINNLHKMNYKVVLVSNQPGIAKGHMSEEAFKQIENKMINELAQGDAHLDGRYYCFHHPEAKVKKLKTKCNCRKPAPGLLLQAANDLNIDLSRSWMIGDGLTDVKAGQSAGCRTILLGRMKCQLCYLMEELDARPDFIASDLSDAAKFILDKEGAGYGNIY